MNPLPYVTVTVRVPERLAGQVKYLAKTSEWQLADLYRTLLSIGASFFFLSYESEQCREAAAALMGGLKLLKVSRSFSLQFSDRPYAWRIPGRKSTLITLNLPRSVRDLISLYASLTKTSRNETYNKCLQQGMLVYLKAQEKIVRASRQ